MKVELEMFTEEDDGAVVLEKLSELAAKAKELGFFVSEAEMEAIEVEVGGESEEGVEEEDKDENEDEDEEVEH
jgi:hypothetical protein